MNTGMNTAMEIGERPLPHVVNSFTSVSLDPALVLFCAGRASRTGRSVFDAGAFAVNVLGGHQRHLARGSRRRHR
jgi:3-hydroxy-9,10-secoandrosta-1,3,5(10)-triene-9,17-dione monooxygenase reductase component